MTEREEIQRNNKMYHKVLDNLLNKHANNIINEIRWNTEIYTKDAK